jgi:tetratricopeptide (TPR) repeat protein
MCNTIKLLQLRIKQKESNEHIICLQSDSEILAESLVTQGILYWSDIPTLQAIFSRHGQYAKGITPQEISDIGTRLYQGLFPDPIHEAFTEALRKAKLSRIPIDLRFQTDSSPYLSLPLEILHHPEEGYLFLKPYVSFSRHPLSGIEPGHASGPPLKVLMFVSSPTDAPPILDFEKEQDTIIQALDPYISKGEAIIEMPDEGTLETLKEYLDRGGYQVLHFSGHGHFNHEEGEGYLLFENGRGQKEEISAHQLADLLINYPSLRLVFLSGCQTASIDYDIFAGVSQQLLKNGIPMIIGMQHSVSDEGATTFAQSFYGELLKARGAGWALASARAALRERHKQSFEWATPALYGGGWIGEIVDINKEPQEPLEPRERPRAFYAGVSYREQGFVGRRSDLRTLRGKIRQGETGIAICGLGGIGKSTLATRLLEKLHWEEGIEVLIFQKEVSPEQVVSALGDTLGGECSRIGRSPDLPWEKKLNAFQNNWPSGKIAILFDNFEDNQNLDGQIKDPEVQKMLTALLSLGRNKLLLILTTRYGLDTLSRHNLGDMGFVSSIKKMYRYPVLRGMDFHTKKEIYDRLGGQPRSMELLAGILHTTEKTWETVKQKVLQAEEAACQDLMLDLLWGELSKKELGLLKRIWVYRLPVDEDAFTLQVQERPIDRYITSLVNRSLIHAGPDEEEVLRYYIHRLTAGYVKNRVTDEEARDAHGNAARYYEYRFRNQGKDIEIHLEARYHHLGAGNLQRAAEIAIAAQSSLRIWGHIERARQLNQETLEQASDERTRALAILNLGIIEQGQGNYDKALSMYEESRKIAMRIGDVAGVSNSYLHIGNTYYLRGKYDKALSMYEESRKIAVRIEDMAGVSKSYHQIGMIYQKRGEYDKAFSKYEESRKIKERIGDVAGVSRSLGQIGNIYYLRREYNMALIMYEESRKIAESIGDVAGISNIYHNIGMIYQDLGEHEKALSMYEESRRIAESIGDVAGVSNIYYQIGVFYHERGEYDKAFSIYEESRKIKKSIGDVAGLALCYGQMGVLSEEKGNYEDAFEYTFKAFSILNQIRSSHVKLALAQLRSLQEKMGAKRFDETWKRLTGLDDIPDFLRNQ